MPEPRKCECYIQEGDALLPECRSLGIIKCALCREREQVGREAVSLLQMKYTTIAEGAAWSNNRETLLDRARELGMVEDGYRKIGVSEKGPR